MTVGLGISPGLLLAAVTVRSCDSPAPAVMPDRITVCGVVVFSVIGAGLAIRTMRPCFFFFFFFMFLALASFSVLLIETMAAHLDRAIPARIHHVFTVKYKTGGVSPACRHNRLGTEKCYGQSLQGGRIHSVFSGDQARMQFPSVGASDAEFISAHPCWAALGVQVSRIKQD